MNSIFTVACFIIGNLVGSGFFLMPSLLAPLGSSLIFSWSIAFFVALIFALIFGRLAIIFKNSSILSDYFENKNLKKIIAIVYWITCIIGNVGLLVIAANSLNICINTQLLGLIIILFITSMLHFFDYHTIENIEILLTIFKFSLLLFLPIAFFAFKPEIFCLPAFKGNLTQTTKFGITCFWSFLGIEAASLFGSGKNVKVGLLIGIIACFILYVFTSLFIVGCISENELFTNNMPFALLANKFFNHNKYSIFLNFLTSFTIFGALYGWIAATSKMALVYAQKNLFPKIFLTSSISKNSLIGLWGSSFVTFILFSLIQSFNARNQFFIIADLCVYITLLIYLLCGYSLLKKAQNKSDYFLGIIGTSLVFCIFCFHIISQI